MKAPNQIVTVILTLVLLLGVNSCTIQKRLYRKGYTVTWNHRYKTEKHEQLAESEDGIGQEESQTNDTVTIAVVTKSEEISSETPTTEVLSETVVNELEIDSPTKTATDLPPSQKATEVHPKKEASKDKKEQHEVGTGYALDGYAVTIWTLNAVLTVLILLMLAFGPIELLTFGGAILMVLYSVLLTLVATIFFIVNVVLGINSLRKIAADPDSYHLPIWTWIGMFYPITFGVALFLGVLWWLGFEF